MTNCTGSRDATKRCSFFRFALLRRASGAGRTGRCGRAPPSGRAKRDRPGGKSAKRLATWGKVYDNEDLARKAKQMEKRVDRLKEEQTTLTAGSPRRLRLQERRWTPITCWRCRNGPCARRGGAGAIQRICG
ncbi:hypothetical protein M8494_09945 [Serratia ureilytica]